MIRFEGRGFRAPEYDIHFSSAGVTFRVDDAENTEAWASLFIPWDKIDAFKKQQAVIEEFAAIMDVASTVKIMDKRMPIDLDQLPDVPPDLPPIPDFPHPDTQK